MEAASAGQVVVGLSAFEPWLIELPWCSHPASAVGKVPDGGIGAQGDQLGDLVVRQPDLDVLGAVVSPVNRTVSTDPAW